MEEEDPFLSSDSLGTERATKRKGCKLLFVYVIAFACLAGLFVGAGMAISYGIFGTGSVFPSPCTSTGTMHTQLEWGAMVRTDGSTVSVLDLLDVLLKAERINETIM